MILVDTSVWIRFLSGREPFASGLDRLLATEDVLSHDLVHGELFVGDRGGRPKLLGAYGLITRAPTVPHDDVLLFAKTQRLHGKGIGWIDVHLLASTRVAGAQLWTADAALSSAARDLGVGYAVDGARSGRASRHEHRP